MNVRVIVICLGIYALYLPAAMFVHHDYAPAIRPVGDVVEGLKAVHYDKPDHYVAARSYMLRTSNFPDTSKIAIYENMTPLPRADFDFLPGIGGYIIRFKTSDGSDPRTNGREYWAVGDFAE
jgi:hypothetical protein